jgi:hypothetical protein
MDPSKQSEGIIIAAANALSKRKACSDAGHNEKVAMGVLFYL